MPRIFAADGSPAGNSPYLTSGGDRVDCVYLVPDTTSGAEEVATTDTIPALSA